MYHPKIDMHYDRSVAQAIFHYGAHLIPKFARL